MRAVQFAVVASGGLQEDWGSWRPHYLAAAQPSPSLHEGFKINLLGCTDNDLSVTVKTLFPYDGELEQSGSLQYISDPDSSRMRNAHVQFEEDGQGFFTVTHTNGLIWPFKTTLGSCVLKASGGTTLELLQQGGISCNIQRNLETQAFDVYVLEDEHKAHPCNWAGNYCYACHYDESKDLCPPKSALPLPSDDASAEGAAKAEPHGEPPASTQPQDSFSFEQDTFIFAPLTVTELV